MAIHQRHNHVRKQQSDLGFALDELQGLIPVASLQHVVAELPQRFPDQPANLSLIFDHEDSLARLTSRPRLVGYHISSLTFQRQRKIKLENRALARMTGYLNRALVLADDAVDRA